MLPMSGAAGKERIVDEELRNLVVGLMLTWGTPFGLGALLGGYGLFLWGRSHDRRVKDE